MELNEAINNRRSIRRYKNLEVEQDKIIEIIKSAQMAPSWKNSQVSRYYIVQEKSNEVRNLLPSFNQMSTENVSTFIITTVVDKRSGYNKEGIAETHLNDGFQYFDNGLQVQNLLLKAHELGLGTLIMGLYDNESLRNLLNVPENEIITSVIALGYPDIAPVAPTRKDINDIVRFM